MRKRTVLIICTLVLLVIVSGCDKPAAIKRSPAEEPMKVLDTYLEGLKERNYDKVKQAVADSVYNPGPEDRKLFEKGIAEQERMTGKTQKWTFDPNPFVDEINNQAIIRTRVTTSKYYYIMDYDLRKMGKWVIYGTNIVSKTSLQKGGANYHQKK